MEQSCLHACAHHGMDFPHCPGQLQEHTTNCSGLEKNDLFIYLSVYLLDHWTRTIEKNDLFICLSIYLIIGLGLERHGLSQTTPVV